MGTGCKWLLTQQVADDPWTLINKFILFINKSYYNLTVFLILFTNSLLMCITLFLGLHLSTTYGIAVYFSYLYLFHLFWRSSYKYPD